MEHIVAVRARYVELGGLEYCGSKIVYFHFLFAFNGLSFNIKELSGFTVINKLSSIILLLCICVGVCLYVYVCSCSCFSSSSFSVCF